MSEPPAFDAAAAAAMVAACERPFTANPGEAGLRAVWAVKHTHLFGGRPKLAWEFYGSTKQRYYEWKKCLEPQAVLLDAALSTLLPEIETMGMDVSGDLRVTGDVYSSGTIRANGFEPNAVAGEEYIEVEGNAVFAVSSPAFMPASVLPTMMRMLDSHRISSG
eukprot:4979279-Prymnesium_polylepis.1